jgi:GxxExxY protein
MSTFHEPQPIRTFQPIPETTEIVAKAVLDAAFKVHTSLGPGLLESVYEACLANELQLRGFAVDTQVVLPIIYEGMPIQAVLRLDMLVEKCLIVEIKAVE